MDPNRMTCAEAPYMYSAAPTTTAPGLYSITPNTGSAVVGQPVTIKGFRFTLFAPASTDVQFGGVSATSIVVVNDNTITCTSPVPGSGTVDVSVINDNGTGVLPQSFTYSGV